eukprot:14546284-Alexandrium_andersonii.AAC.1
MRALEARRPRNWWLALLDDIGIGILILGLIRKCHMAPRAGSLVLGIAVVLAGRGVRELLERCQQP